MPSASTSTPREDIPLSALGRQVLRLVNCGEDTAKKLAAAQGVSPKIATKRLGYLKTQGLVAYSKLTRTWRVLPLGKDRAGL